MPGTALGSECGRECGRHTQPHRATILEETADKGNTQEALVFWTVTRLWRKRRHRLGGAVVDGRCQGTLLRRGRAEKGPREVREAAPASREQLVLRSQFAGSKLYEYLTLQEMPRCFPSRLCQGTLPEMLWKSSFWNIAFQHWIWSDFLTFASLRFP